MLDFTTSVIAIRILLCLRPQVYHVLEKHLEIDNISYKQDFHISNIMILVFDMTWNCLSGNFRVTKANNFQHSFSQKIFPTVSESQND